MPDPGFDPAVDPILCSPYAVPAGNRPVAVKAITRTGAEMNAVIHPEAWRPPTDHQP